jgi:hypothetical protein
MSKFTFHHKKKRMVDINHLEKAIQVFRDVFETHSPLTLLKAQTPVNLKPALSRLVDMLKTHAVTYRLRGGYGKQAFTAEQNFLQLKDGLDFDFV